MNEPNRHMSKDLPPVDSPRLHATGSRSRGVEERPGPTISRRAFAGSAALWPWVGFALGTETWGSIVTPASFCGVSGLRPTYGRISRHGAMALSWTMDKLGPMCRSADDCEIVLRAIAGPDEHDPTTSSGLLASAP
ncbi:MAG: amidase family protein [Gemmatimonadota bacterium]